MACTALRLENNSKARTFAPRQKAGLSEPLILIVEDDASTRRWLCALLKWSSTAGIMEASNPDAALLMARAAARPIDLLISDINLGSDKDGLELAREIASANPRVKVLLISGGPKPERDMPSGWRFLAKPFKIAEFLAFVRASLETGRGGTGGLAAGVRS